MRPFDDAVESLRPSDPSKLASVTAGETIFCDLRDEGRPLCDPSCDPTGIIWWSPLMECPCMG